MYLKISSVIVNHQINLFMDMFDDFIKSGKKYIANNTTDEDGRLPIEAIIRISKREICNQ